MMFLHKEFRRNFCHADEAFRCVVPNPMGAAATEAPGAHGVGDNTAECLISVTKVSFEIQTWWVAPESALRIVLPRQAFPRRRAASKH